MSIATGTEWEIRTTGYSDNGGGFSDLNPGTSVDYSQQDAPQLALTDIASDGAGTTITSSTGGFTAAMEGNVMYISGTGFTEGWYQIVGYTDTNTITIDRSCGASASGGTGNVGGAWLPNSTNWNTFFNTLNKSTYNICHIAAGTYSSLGTTALTITATYLRFNGYNTTRGDQPEGDNRPLFSFGDNAAYFNLAASYAWVNHLRIDNQHSSAATTTFYATGNAIVVRNCKFTRSGYSGEAVACNVGGSYAKVFEVEASCTNGTAIRITNSLSTVNHSWMHDSKYGLVAYGGASYSLRVDHCIISNCTTTGFSSNYNTIVSNCVVYACGTGVTFTTQNYCAIYNSIIQGCTTGLVGDVHLYNDNNILYNNTTQYSGGVVAGPNSLTSDPLLVDPANDDFTLDAGSPAFEAALCIGTKVGLP